MASFWLCWMSTGSWISKKPPGRRELQTEEVAMKHCLVVDDSRVIRKVARRILEELKFDISEACDGKEALDVCRSTMPDAILLDWNMPIMNGIEFLRALRREKGGSN